MGTCKMVCGGRSLFARVTLELSPSDTLTFGAQLDDGTAALAAQRGWLRAVCFGCLDTALVYPALPVTVFRCVLTAIEFHEVDSSAQAFRLAARNAMRAFLEADEWTS